MVAALAARIAKLAIRHRLPSIGGGRCFVHGGGLVSYCADSKAAWRAAARYVDRILKAAKPADLAVDQIDAIELVVNLRAAKALRIEIPTALVTRANDVVR
jgi:putative ABC transport system substrate-binding protein